ncbi:hypothetical protein HZC32_03595 [Candidatus Woesearchaeota archaeon]|nr:hypothetical protein [Candidatus Woesearchaeota archaeon]
MATEKDVAKEFKELSKRTEVLHESLLALSKRYEQFEKSAAAGIYPPNYGQLLKIIRGGFISNPQRWIRKVWKNKGKIEKVIDYGNMHSYVKKASNDVYTTKRIKEVKYFLKFYHDYRDSIGVNLGLILKLLSSGNSEAEIFPFLERAKREGVSSEEWNKFLGRVKEVGNAIASYIWIAGNLRRIAKETLLYFG